MVAFGPAVTWNVTPAGVAGPVEDSSPDRPWPRDNQSGATASSMAAALSSTSLSERISPLRTESSRCACAVAAGQSFDLDTADAVVEVERECQHHSFGVTHGIDANVAGFTWQGFLIDDCNSRMVTVCPGFNVTSCATALVSNAASARKLICPIRCVAGRVPD